jgi:hypothetical protein
MSWVLFRWLTLGWLATAVGFCALPLLFCLGMPESVGFPLTQAVIAGNLACAAAVGSVVAAGHLLGVRLLRCPLCRSRAGWVLRNRDPFLRCPGCGDVYGGGVLRPWAVEARPREDRPWDIEPRFRPVAAGLLAACLGWYLWLVARNSG